LLLWHGDRKEQGWRGKGGQKETNTLPTTNKRDQVWMSWAKNNSMMAEKVPFSANECKTD